MWNTSWTRVSTISFMVITVPVPSISTVLIAAIPPLQSLPRPLVKPLVWLVRLAVSDLPDCPVWVSYLTVEYAIVA